MQRLSAWLLAALSAAASAAASSAKQAAPGDYDTGCYYGDGTEARDWDFQSCGHKNTTFNTCCLPSDNDLCLANGLCEYPGNYIYRGPCDNVHGNGCRSICPEVNPNSWVEVQSCTTTEWCCSPGRNAGKAGNCCTDGSNRFRLPDPIKQTTTSARSSASTSFASSTPISSSAPSPSAPMPTPGGHSSGGSDSSTPVGAIVGGVVGGVAGLGVIGAAAWLLLRRRRKHGAAREAELPGYSAVETKDSPYGAAPAQASPPVEMLGHPAPVESDSRPVQRFEMAG